MLLDVQKSKSGDSMVIIDPGGDVHACPTAEEFWTTVQSILNNPEIPQATQVPPPRSNGGGAGEFVAEGDDLVAEVGGRVLQGLLSGLQNISYRGKPPKRGKKQEESGG